MSNAGAFHRLAKAIPTLGAKAIRLLQRVAALETQVIELRAALVSAHSKEKQRDGNLSNDVQAMLIRAADVSSELGRIGTNYDSLALRVARLELVTPGEGSTSEAPGKIIAEWRTLDQDLRTGSGSVLRRMMFGRRHRNEAADRMNAIVGRLATQCLRNAEAIESLTSELGAMRKQHVSQQGSASCDGHKEPQT